MTFIIQHFINNNNNDKAMPEERTHKSFWFPRSIDVKDNKIRFEGGSWESTWTTEGTMVRDNNSTNSPESDYRNALDRAANEDYPGYPMPAYYRQRIMDQLISRPRIFAYHDTLRELVLGNHLDTLSALGIYENTRQRRVAIQYDSFEVADRLGNHLDGLFRGIDINVAASGTGRHNRFDLAAAAADAGDDEGDEEDDDDYPIVSV